MAKYIIANPPCGIYKGDLPLGYAYYQTLLDIHARFQRDSKGSEVICPKYSLNALGKRAEGLGLDRTIEALDQHVKSWIAGGRLRDKMNFSFEGNILDTSPESVEETTRVFRELYEKSYSFRDGRTFYLDAAKIKKDFDLEGIAQEINFFSDRSQREFARLVQDSTKPVRITKEREYAVPNPFGGEAIAPIFGVANLWGGHFDQEIDFMAASEKELTRYLMLRFLSQIPVSEQLPLRNVLVYNYISPEGGFEEWNMETLTQDGVGSDSLRYAFAKSFSLAEQKAELRKDLLKGGKKLVYLTGNLKKLFLKEGFRFEGFPDMEDPTYVEEMDSLQYPSVLGHLERKLRELSNGINTARDRGYLDTKKGDFFKRYLKLSRQLNPFCPFISEKIIRDLVQGEI